MLASKYIRQMRSNKCMWSKSVLSFSLSLRICKCACMVITVVIHLPMPDRQTHTNTFILLTSNMTVYKVLLYSMLLVQSVWYKSLKAHLGFKQTLHLENKHTYKTTNFSIFFINIFFFNTIKETY